MLTTNSLVEVKFITDDCDAELHQYILGEYHISFVILKQVDTGLEMMIPFTQIEYIQEIALKDKLEVT